MNKASCAKLLKGTAGRLFVDTAVCGDLEVSPDSDSDEAMVTITDSDARSSAPDHKRALVAINLTSVRKKTPRRPAAFTTSTEKCNSEYTE